MQYVFARLEETLCWSLFSREGVFLWKKKDIEKFLANSFHLSLSLDKLYLGTVVKKKKKKNYFGPHFFITIDKKEWRFFCLCRTDEEIRQEIESLKRSGRKFILAKKVSFKISVRLKIFSWD